MLENDAEQGQEPSVYLATKGAQAPKPHAKLDWRAWAWHEADILWDMIRSSWLNLLLVVVPVAIGLGFAHANSTAVFVLNFVALIPLALLLGDVTEHLAERFGDVIGGLLNATFGNIVEIVLAIQALRKDLIMLVQMSLIGSVLSNLLLVLGFVFAFGGYYHHTQSFSIESTQAQTQLLFLAAIGLCIPTAAQYVITASDMSQQVVKISHASAIMMLSSYLLYLLFQLYTHPELGEGEDEDDDEDEERLSEGNGQQGHAEEDGQVTQAAEEETTGVNALVASSVHSHASRELVKSTSLGFLQTVPSGRALSRYEVPPRHPLLTPINSVETAKMVAATAGVPPSGQGRSISGRPHESLLDKMRNGSLLLPSVALPPRHGGPGGAVLMPNADGASSDQLRARTRSGQPMAKTASLGHGSPIKLINRSESDRRASIDSSAVGRPIEVLRTASGRVVEMVRTASGRLVELCAGGGGADASVTGGGAGTGMSRFRTGSGRAVSTAGPSVASTPLRSLDRAASGRYLLRTASGRHVSDLELIDINRARRISGRPPLKNVVVVSTPLQHQQLHLVPGCEAGPSGMPHPEISPVSAPASLPTSTGGAASVGGLGDGQPPPAAVTPMGSWRGDRNSPSPMAVVGEGQLGSKGEVLETLQELVTDAYTSPILSVPVAVLLLATIAVLVAINCEFLTEAIQEFGDATGISQPFIGMIILPIAGNACEHLTAVVMASKNKMNLALGIAVGSALQISLLAIPFVCIVSWGMGRTFELNVDVFALFSLLFSIIITYVLLASGKSTWLSGVSPTVIYVVIAVAYFYQTQSVDFGR